VPPRAPEHGAGDRRVAADQRLRDGLRDEQQQHEVEDRDLRQSRQVELFTSRMKNSSPPRG